MLLRLAVLALQIDLIQGMMDCLYAKCIPCITDCVMAELEKLGTKYRVALKVAKVRTATQASYSSPLIPLLPRAPQQEKCPVSCSGLVCFGKIHPLYEPKEQPRPEGKVQSCCM